MPAEVYVDLETPSGEILSASATIEMFDPSIDSLVTFDIDYVPTDLGEYMISYSNNYNTDFFIDLYIEHKRAFNDLYEKEYIGKKQFLERS